MNRLLYASMEGNQSESRHLSEKLNVLVSAICAPQPSETEEPSAEMLSSMDMKLKKQIEELIQAEYSNPQLNVSYIADQLGKSIDRISRSFKAATSIGLLDYIHHVRIRAAKEIMDKDPSLSVNLVSQRVGYASVDSFTRAFKRIEGTTPGKYRDEIENSL